RTHPFAVGFAVDSRLSSSHQCVGTRAHKNSGGRIGLACHRRRSGSHLQVASPALINIVSPGRRVVMSVRTANSASEKCMSRRLRPFICGFLGAVLVGTLAATPSFAQSGKIEKPDITFGVFPITNYGVVYLSMKEGFFEAEGLRVTPRVM